MLHKKIKNYPRIYNDVSYSSEILISFCKVSFDCKIEDTKVIKFENSVSKVSDYDGYKGISYHLMTKMVQIFKEYGPILEYDDLKDLAREIKLKRFFKYDLAIFSIISQNRYWLLYINRKIKRKYIGQDNLDH